MIAIIDYGMGNLHSVCNALSALGFSYCVSSDPEVLKQADGLILPGVGAFRDCMNNLQKASLIDVIKEQANSGKPLLGICLGMQVLFEKGYEVEETQGLGLLHGEIVLMKFLILDGIVWKQPETMKSCRHRNIRLSIMCILSMHRITMKRISLLILSTEI